MKVGRVGTMEIRDEAIPDWFRVSLTGSDERATMVYKEYYRVPEKVFWNMSKTTNKIMKKHGIVPKDEYKNGVGTTTVVLKGSKGELLSAILSEILLQIRFYYDEDYIREIYDSSKVYEYHEYSGDD